MIRSLELHEFLDHAKTLPVFDVRTPAEFEQGHIPHAHNLPLFSNEERALVGTCYKQQGRQEAILLGFELIGSRWAGFIKQVNSFFSKEILSSTEVANKKVLVHCWRGGMRSGAMAWALNVFGFEVYTLKGGYKKFRQQCLRQLQDTYPIVVLSGKTGSAKTETLHEMKNMGEQIIDLEGLANHQGSSYGSMGTKIQPSQEQFENILAWELSALDNNRRIWFENESVVIGKRVIPPAIFEQMREAEIFDLDLPIEVRVDFLTKVYGSLDPDFLKESTLKISKRLGPNETKLCLQAIDEGRMRDFIRLALVYYDKYYLRSQEKRRPETIHTVGASEINPKQNASRVIHMAGALKVLPLLNL